MLDIDKYPRTTHLAGSALQKGDGKARISTESLRSRGTLRIEEKFDGANCGLSFRPGGGQLMLQSRGHILTGGARERQFNLFKSWAQSHEAAFSERLGERYIMYGEWMFAKHSAYYTDLPAYFLEFDIKDRDTGVFLSTPARHQLLDGLPVVSVPVIHEGWVADKELPKLVRPSLYKSADWRERLRFAATVEGLDPDRVMAETDDSDLAEGLYVKHEDDFTGTVIGRYKFVRAAFIQAIIESGSHWASRPILRNELAPGVDIFAQPTVSMGI